MVHIAPNVVSAIDTIARENVLAAKAAPQHVPAKGLDRRRYAFLVRVQKAR